MRSLAFAPLLLLIFAASAGAAVTNEVVGNTLTVRGDGELDAIDLAVIDGRIAINGIPTALAADANAEILVEPGGGRDLVDAKALAAGTYKSLQLIGGEGDDSMAGGAGTDTLDGDSGADVLGGFKGADTILGGEGNDSIVWNEGDGDDEAIGGAGQFDLLGVNASDADGDELELVAEPTARFERRNLVPFAIDMPGGQEDLEQISVDLRGGNDTFTTASGLPEMHVLLIGGPGEDQITGGDAADQLFGGEGDDIIDGGGSGDVLFGQVGDDRIVGGAGDDFIDGNEGGDRIVGDGGPDFVLGGGDDDVVIWNDGDGSEEAQGERGFDRLEVNGSETEGDVLELAVEETTKLRRTNLDPFTLKLPEFEEVAMRAGGGNDALGVSPGLTGLRVSADGGPGDDVLNGSEEPDEFLGGPGEDTLSAGAGEDLLMARDRQSDIVRGGDGEDSAQTDEVTVDAIDGVEHLDATPPPPGGPPPPPLQPPADRPPAPVQPPPALDTIALLPRLGKVALAASSRKLLAKVPVSCPAEEAGGCRTTLTLKTAKPLPGTVIGSRTVGLAPAGRTTASIHISPRAAALAKNGRLPVRIGIASTDAAGNTANRTVAATLRLPRRR